MDKPTAFVISFVLCIVAAVITTVAVYNFREQTTTQEIMTKCSQMGGVYVNAYQMQGCVKLSPITIEGR